MISTVFVNGKKTISFCIGRNSVGFVIDIVLIDPNWIWDLLTKSCEASVNTKYDFDSTHRLHIELFGLF